MAGTVVGRLGGVGVESGSERRWRRVLRATLEKCVFSSGFLFQSQSRNRMIRI